jgi:predicted ArsR family transcriptional regulator
MLHGNQRFFASTRGKIVILLRRGSRTVHELAQMLELTDNAVRAHLVTLERDGFVLQQGARRGSGKPSFIYKLAPEAEQLFPKAYDLMLNQLLDSLAEQKTTEEMDNLMRTVGHRLATKWHVPPGDLRTRLEMAVEILNALGGLSELEEHDGTYSIRGRSGSPANLSPC